MSDKMPITELIERLSALEAKATKGLWHSSMDGRPDLGNVCNLIVGNGDLLVYGQISTGDADFIAALRNAWPLLVAHIAALERRVSGPNDAGPVLFYERDFYVLSNFSAFNLHWRGITFPTSEHAYHYEKFCEVDGPARVHRAAIRIAPSAHEAFKHAERHRDARRPDWDDVRVGIMRHILRAKAEQHEYVRRKLLATGDRELIEDSWRDDYWGWGPNRDGQNMLGKLWMEVRAEFRALTPAKDGGEGEAALDAVRQREYAHRYCPGEDGRCQRGTDESCPVLGAMGQREA